MKLRTKFFLLTTGFLSFFLGQINAQVDPHTSQYYVYPLNLNPAMVGTFNGDVRVGGAYRNQWANIVNPFITQAISVEARTNRNIQFGFNILNQSSGGGGFNYYNTSFSLAYTGIQFGAEAEHHVTFGMQAGVIDRSVNPSKFQLGDQWNPITGYNPGVTNDKFTVLRSSVLDIGAGLLYYNTSESSRFNPYLGFSAFHLNKPIDPFSQSAINSGDIIPVRYVVHGGASMQVAENMLFVPHFIYMKQGTANNFVAGAFWQIDASDDAQVLMGANYRFKDALIPYVGLRYNQQVLASVSYDANVSSLKSLAGNANCFEFTLSYTYKSKNRASYLKCPAL